MGSILLLYNAKDCYCKSVINEQDSIDIFSLTNLFVTTSSFAILKIYYKFFLWENAKSGKKNKKYDF